MPANWGSFTAAMNSWFCGDAEGGDTTSDGNPTAKKIATEYASAISISAGPLLNMYMTGLDKSKIEDGFTTSFKSQYQAAGIPPEGMDAGTANWIPAATGVVQSWLNVKFQGFQESKHVSKKSNRPATGR